MGVSTDAILAFGFNIADEDEMPEKLAAAGHDPEEYDGYFDFDLVVAREVGLTEPTGPYESNKELYSAYFEAKRKAAAAYPLDVIAHCSGECPMRFLAVRGTEVNASRGNPVRLTDYFPLITVEQIRAMRDFCERYEIEWQEPGWHLFSMWN